MTTTSSQYRDNYPNNIEAPQRVYVQYSQDISFDYSTGKYPLGETFEGFIWENVYIPVQHTLGDLTLGRHTWMRWRIGEKESWTLPMRLTDSILNIETTTIEYETNPNQIKFKFKYTLNTGQVVYSEYMYIPMPEDGRGILNSQITNNNLILTYTDNTTQNVGRVVGFDGTGVPIGTTDYNILISLNDEPQWITLISQLNNNLTGALPIIYNNGNYSHSNVDGYRHIPIGGNLNDSLTTNGLGNYTWQSMIPYTAINDLAGSGDTTLLWSADKLTNVFNTLSTFGIKYSLSLYSELALITDPDEGDLAVITADPLYPNRPVFKYISSNWVSFFDLDAAHNHNDLYYTKTELSTSGGGVQIDWGNIINVPSSLGGWFITDGTSTTEVSGGETLTISAGAGILATLTGNTLALIASYIEGQGITISGNTISHYNTSNITNTANTLGQVIQNLAFDEFGHAITKSSINLDTRYSLLTHSHSTLTRGTGLTGSNYNGSSGTTWNVSFAGTGSANTVARSDHNHDGGSSAILSYWGSSGHIYADWYTDSYMNQVNLNNGSVMLWGYLRKNGANSNEVNINSTNPLPPNALVSIRLINSLGLTNIFKLYPNGMMSMTGPFYGGEMFEFSITYYLYQ
ncbi:MAG: hypothetical protein M0R17_04630 [Candidatus Omnitrophica bacterium]|jgi:hypothetical protein|nr:hypothetical protein [Candidatus Omnitrophota bacterium]